MGAPGVTRTGALGYSFLAPRWCTLEDGLCREAQRSREQARRIWSAALE